MSCRVCQLLRPKGAVRLTTRNPQGFVKVLVRFREGFGGGAPPCKPNHAYPAILHWQLARCFHFAQTLQVRLDLHMRIFGFLPQ